MKCSICGEEKPKSVIITIVHDPPIDVCPQCSTDKVFAEWLINQKVSICELGLKLDGFNWDELKNVYKATGVRLVKPERSNYDGGLVFKCVACGMLFGSLKEACSHVENHDKTDFGMDDFMEETPCQNVNFVGVS